MDLGLAGKVFIVTGGSGGLGRATAQALLDEGARVVVSGRNRDRLDEVVAQWGDHAVGVEADNADPTTADVLVAVARDSFGRLDGALISVGGPPAGPVMEVSDEMWLQSFDTIFVGGLRIARAVAGALDEGGALAFVLSSSVRMPLPGMALSNGLRPGVAMAAKTMADELGPRGIRLNALLPGRLETDRVAWLDGQTDDPAGTRAAHEANIPLSRYGTPEEFGRTAAFLLSPAASYLTGVMLPVDGGLQRGL